MSYENDNQPEEKTSFGTILIVILIVIPIVMFVRSKMVAVEKAPEQADEYLTAVREKMMQDFDPSGITNSGYCIISFEITPEGWINKRQMITKSTVEEINQKVFHMLKSTTIVDKPPAVYTNKPIEIEFGCIADAREASCYSKNIVKKQTPQEE